MIIQKGARVKTPRGEGVIVYARLAPPTFNTPEVYSVLLDKNRKVIGYSGTIIPAYQVEPL